MGNYNVVIYTLRCCEEGNDEICRQIDRARKDHAEWGNPDPETNITYSLICGSQFPIFINTESSQVQRNHERDQWIGQEQGISNSTGEMGKQGCAFLGEGRSIQKEREGRAKITEKMSERDKYSKEPNILTRIQILSIYLKLHRTHISACIYI